MIHVMIKIKCLALRETYSYEFSIMYEVFTQLLFDIMLME